MRLKVAVPGRPGGPPAGRGPGRSSTPAPSSWGSPTWSTRVPSDAQVRSAVRRRRTTCSTSTSPTSAASGSALQRLAVAQLVFTLTELRGIAIARALLRRRHPGLRPDRERRGQRPGRPSTVPDETPAGPTARTPPTTTTTTAARPTAPCPPMPRSGPSRTCADVSRRTGSETRADRRRGARRWSLPVLVWGSSSTTNTSFGHLYAASVLAGVARCTVAGVTSADHRRAHPLSPPLVGRRRRPPPPRTPGGLDEDVLDLGRVDVHPAGDDQVVTAALEVEEAVGVEPTEVADGERRASRQRRRPPACRLGRVAPVLEAGVARHRAPDRCRRRRPSSRRWGRARPTVPGVGFPVRARAGGELALGRAVELPDRSVGEGVDGGRA